MFTPLKTFLFLSLLILFPVVADAALYRDLSLGSQGEDVRELQQLLNANSVTQIAASGPGSPGQETTYFGALTQSAVIRYQNLYASQILAPLGLSSGTGYVGASTRSYLSGGTTQNLSSVTVVTNASGAKTTQTTPVITSVQPQKGGVGTVVTFYGSGFASTGNTIGSAFEVFNDVSSADGRTLQITIKGPPFPDGFLEEHHDYYEEEQAEMAYSFVVINEFGKSNFVPFTFTLY